MKDVRCCDCGWLLEKSRECTACAPDCVIDNEALRVLSAEQCLARRNCDCYTPKDAEGHE